jgi:CBS domain-containing protein
MKRDVVCLNINATLEEVIDLMTKHRIGLPPLVDEHKELSGSSSYAMASLWTSA